MRRGSCGGEGSEVQIVVLPDAAGGALERVDFTVRGFQCTGTDGVFVPVHPCPDFGTRSLPGLEFKHQFSPINSICDCGLSHWP
jgi:hypothetical protein